LIDKLGLKALVVFPLILDSKLLLKVSDLNSNVSLAIDLPIGV
jgi:hypothetical protein